MLQTKFFPLCFMAQVPSTQAVNPSRKTRFHNLKYGLRTQGKKDVDNISG